ncbi:MarR family transcriptional regulator [Sphingobium sufflavum]|uniref:MarR family winged helix-turn-helix transcriptional regulator n=1 Tax=Sphingobium sufflavum TaxID=1129547 RepID=UPI001F47B803|nr:MarR family transcriptional regulator [Sphingobium sufflavum]MCE7798213.1 MarR family transcriptional regulator [Sphingobium sufflavum]
MADLPQLNDHLGYRLRQVSNHVSHRFAQKMADSGVTVAEWVTLRLLHGAAPITSGALALRMGMTRGAITKLVDRLHVKQLVDRAADAEDARIRILSLTAQGRALLPRLAALAEENEAECFGHLWEEERALFAMLLDRMVDRLDLSDIAVE